MAVNLEKNIRRRRGVDVLKDENRCIPEDVIDDILSRLPVKSLIKFKSLSKLYSSKISSPWFSKISYKHHLTKSHNLFLRRVRGEHPWKFSLVRLEGQKFQTVAELGAPFGPAIPIYCYNGIVLLGFKKSHEGLVLWNPSIKRYTMIPTPPDLIYWPFWNSKSQFGLYHDSRTDDYKIVFITNKYNWTYSCKTTTWIKDEPSFNKIGVFVDGCFYYWSQKEIAYFDFRERKFGKLEEPDMKADPTDLMILSALRGRLHVYCISEDGRKFQFRVMQKEAQGLSWTELNNMEIMEPHFSPTYLIGTGGNIVKCGPRFIVYNHFEKKFEQGRTVSCVKSIDLLTYSESLFFPD